MLEKHRIVYEKSQLEHQEFLDHFKKRDLESINDKSNIVLDMESNNIETNTKTDQNLN